MWFTRENFELVKRGRKTATSRRIESLGYYRSKEGKRAWAIDSFDKSRRQKIFITDVHVLTLAEIKTFHYDEEGYDSSEEFERVWRSIHGDFVGAQKVAFVRFALGWG